MPPACRLAGLSALEARYAASMGALNAGPTQPPHAAMGRRSPGRAAACAPRARRNRQARCWNSGSAWLRPRIAPLAIMVAAAAGALSGRVFRAPGEIMPPARSGRWRVVERRAFEEPGGIVGIRPCGRGEDKGDKASAGKHRSVLRAFPRSISARRSIRSRQCRRGADARRGVGDA